MKEKALTTFKILFILLAITLFAWQGKNLKRVDSAEEDRKVQIFSVILSAVGSFVDTLVSLVLSFPQLIVGLITTLVIILFNVISGVLFLVSSVTRTTTTTTTTTTTEATTMMPVTTSSLPTTAMMTTSLSMGASTTSSVPPTMTSTGVSTSASSTSASSTSTTTTTSTTTVALPPQKLVFVTNQTFDGDLGGVAGADEKCQLAAEGASLDGNFSAWISDSSTSPNLRFIRSEVPYVDLNGTTIAMNYSDLTDFTVLFPPSVDENGNALPQGPLGMSLRAAWTSTLTDGSAITAPLDFNCENWTSTAGQVFGTAAVDWSEVSFLTCNREARLYCFQQ